MKWIVERGEECDEIEIDHSEMDDAVLGAQGIVADFMRQYPSSKIDTVKLVIRCKNDKEVNK